MRYRIWIYWLFLYKKQLFHASGWATRTTISWKDVAVLPRQLLRDCWRWQGLWLAVCEGICHSCLPGWPESGHCHWQGADVVAWCRGKWRFHGSLQKADPWWRKLIADFRKDVAFQSTSWGPYWRPWPRCWFWTSRIMGARCCALASRLWGLARAATHTHTHLVRFLEDEGASLSSQSEMTAKESDGAVKDADAKFRGRLLDLPSLSARSTLEEIRKIHQKRVEAQKRNLAT